MKSLSGVTFICTDKGAHRSIELGESSYHGGLSPRRRDHRAKWRPTYDHNGEWALNAPPNGEAGRRKMGGRTVIVPYVMIRGERMSGGWLDPNKEVSWELLCPKCGRNPQISGERLKTALAALKDAGITEVDISSLPF